MASKSFSIKQHFQVMLSLKKKNHPKDTRAHKIVVRNFVYLHDKQQRKGDKKKSLNKPVHHTKFPGHRTKCEKNLHNERGLSRPSTYACVILFQTHLT